jgi:hypothetical protein
LAARILTAFHSHHASCLSRQIQNVLDQTAQN